MQSAKSEYTDGVVAWGATDAEVTSVATTDRKCPNCGKWAGTDKQLVRQVLRIKGFKPSKLIEWAGYIAWRCTGITPSGTCPVTFWISVGDHFLDLVRERGGWFATNFFRP